MPAFRAADNPPANPNLPAENSPYPRRHTVIQGAPVQHIPVHHAPTHPPAHPPTHPPTRPPAHAPTQGTPVTAEHSNSPRNPGTPAAHTSHDRPWRTRDTDARTRESLFPEGPTEPLNAVKPQPTAQRRGGAAVVVAVVISVLALLISAVAGYFSWRAAGQNMAHQPAPVATVPVDRPPEPEEYPVAYAKEPLRVQVGCSAVIFLDLDEPRADAQEAVADLRYDSRCGDEPPRLSLGAGAQGGSQRNNADADAAGCLRAIRTSPLGPGADVEVKRGTALCVLTAGVPAVLALVEIIDVGGTGTAGLRATSWKVPA